MGLFELIFQLNSAGLDSWFIIVDKFREKIYNVDDKIC